MECPPYPLPYHFYFFLYVPLHFKQSMLFHLSLGLKPVWHLRAPLRCISLENVVIWRWARASLTLDKFYFQCWGRNPVPLQAVQALNYWATPPENILPFLRDTGDWAQGLSHATQVSTTELFPQNCFFVLFCGPGLPLTHFLVLQRHRYLKSLLVFSWVR